jgi:DNA-binding IclR family transcriptional regulator
MKATQAAARNQKQAVAAPAKPSVVAEWDGGYALAPGVVKSAGRVIQIFEFFDTHRREANMIEVAAALGYPQSSASALLRSLVALGYLHYDTRRRTYRPTERVALLGSWVSPPLFRDGRLLRLMEDLRRRTGLSVVLIARNGLHAQIYKILQGNGPAKTALRGGQLDAIAASGMGEALLSTYPDAEFRKIGHRINAEATSAAQVVNVAELLQSLRGIRALGFLYTEPAAEAPLGLVAVRLPAGLADRPLAIAMAGPIDVVKPRRQMLADLMRETIRRAFAPPAQPAAAPTNVTPIRPNASATAPGPAPSV